MNRRAKVLLLILSIGLIGSVAGGIEWYQTTETEVYEDTDELVVEVENERVDTLAIAETQSVATAEEDGAVLSAVYSPESSVSTTYLGVVWKIPDGFWYDTRLQIETNETQYASFGEPFTTSYSSSRVFDCEPDVIAAGTHIQLDYPLGCETAKIDTLIHAVGGASNETVEFEVRLTSSSMTGDSIEATATFEIEYSDSEL